MASWRYTLPLRLPGGSGRTWRTWRSLGVAHTPHVAHATRSVAVIVVFPFNYAKQIFAFCIRNPRNQTKPNQQCPQSLSRAAICAATAPHRSSLTMLDLPRAIVITVRGTHPHTHKETERHSCICTLDHVRLIPFACRWLLGHTTWGSSMRRLQQPNCSRNRDSATCHIIESHSPAAFDIDTHTHPHPYAHTQPLRLVQSTANSCHSQSRNQSQRQSHGPCHKPEAFACAPQICLSVFQGNPNCSQPHFRRFRVPPRCSSSSSSPCLSMSSRDFSNFAF